MTTSSSHQRPVLAATRWPSNAEMIEDVVRLGYIRPTDRVFDATWGSGVWWRKYTHPGEFIANCADFDKRGKLKTPELQPGWSWVQRDFRNTELPDDWCDVYTFDPPYVSKGGRATSTIPKFLAAYGLRDAAKTPEALHAYNVDGLLEARRVVKPGGYVLVKVMNYISSASLQPAAHWMRDTALEEGFKLVEDWVHVGDPGPQPKENIDGSKRRQVHARNNYSVLLILQRPKMRRRR